jgi:hypothetical protein
MNRCNRLRALGMLVLALGHGSCTGSGEAERLSQQLSAEVSAKAGMQVAVTCPDFVPDGITRCQARPADGQTFTLEVRRTADGNWEWKGDQAMTGSSLAEYIVEQLAENFQAQLSDVTCPTVVAKGSGQPTSCRGRVEGVDMVIDVEFKPDGIDLTTHPGFLNPAFAAQVARDELARRGMQVEVACGSKHPLAVPYAKFACTARNAAGNLEPLYFRIAADGIELQVRGTPFPW